MTLSARARRLALAILVLLGLAGGLMVAELGARVWESVRRPRKDSLGVDDPIRHHRWKPRARGRVRGIEYETNSLGLRDREYAERKPAGAFRILMLGDSFTEGWTLPLEGVVAKRLEQSLALRCRFPYEVINAGNASYSPILQYLLLEEIGPRLRPDLVLLNFDMTDVHDDFIRTRLARLDANGLPVAVPADRRREAALLVPPLGPSLSARALDPVNQWLKSSVLYQAFRRARLGQWLLGPIRLSPERLEALGLVGNVRYDVLAITRDGDYPGLAAAWAATERYILGIRDLARANGAAFVLVVYPYAHQISATASPEGRRKFGIGPGLYASEAPFRILEHLGRRAGFPVLNLRSFIRSALEAQERAGGLPFYWPHDIHFTVHGARAFAEGLEQGLWRQGFLTDCLLAH
ncbi:MAG: hypothetical protein ACREKS_11920 [Candidatus Rokuibacteriota bacterium]